MYPILYEQITLGTVPAHNGLGVLSDCISCEVEAVANDLYELVIDYPLTGIHAEDIFVGRYIKAKPNPTDDPQLFEIDRVGKVMNGKFSIYAKHISYRLSGFDITSGTAGNAVAACSLLQSACQGFTITTDKTVNATFKIDTPASVRSYFAGREGSFLDVFGKTEIKYDNFRVRFLLNAGQDRGETIRYGKNLLELSQEIDGSNLYTHVRCFYKDTDGNVTVGNKVATGLTLPINKTLVVDSSSDFEDTPTVAQLTARATQYKNDNNLTTPNNNITLDFAQSEGLTGRVDLFDTVTIYYEALGIERAKCKCIRTKYDCIREKYIETEFGDVKADLSDTLASTSKTLANTPTTSFMESSVKRATELITGNLGGNVVIHKNAEGRPFEILVMDTDNIETATKLWRWGLGGFGYSSTGYDGSYGTAITMNGEIVADFITAGTLNANLIKAGVISDVNNRSSIDLTSGIAKLYYLNARYRLRLLGDNDAVKFQVVHNVGGGTNMTFYLNNGTDVGGFACSDTGGLEAILNDKNGTEVARLGSSFWLHNKAFIGNNSFVLYNNGTQVATLSSNGLNIPNIGSITSNGLDIPNVGGITPNGTSVKSSLRINKSNGNPMARFILNSYGRGQLDLYNEYDSPCASLYGDGGLGLGYGGSFTITGIGSTGVLTCISLVQTSSRKTKENIKPIEDTEKILELKAVSFDFKNKEHGTNKRGFIAEDVKEVLPNLVVDGDTPSLNYIEMIPYLQDIVKKQNKRIDELESRIARLEEMLQSSKGE